MKKFWNRLCSAFGITLLIFILQTDYILSYGYGAAVACWVILWFMGYFVVSFIINKVINKLLKKDW